MRGLKRFSKVESGGGIVDNSTDGLYEGMRQMLIDNKTEEYKELSLERAKSFDIEKTMSEVYSVL